MGKHTLEPSGPDTRRRYRTTSNRRGRHYRVSRPDDYRNALAFLVGIVLVVITTFAGYRAFGTRRARPLRSPAGVPLETPVVVTAPYSRGVGTTLLSFIDILLGCGIFLVVAEVLLTTVGVITGATAHAVLVAALLFRSTLVSPQAQIASGNVRAQPFLYQLAPILALISLVRILSLVIPHREIPQFYWYAMIGAPILLGAALIARLNTLSWRDMGMGSLSTPGSAVGQVLIAASGIPLGLAGFAILRPESPLVDVDSAHAPQLIASVVIIIVFVGFLEELLFRGLLQQSASQFIGAWALPWASIIYAAMFLGSDSLTFVVFMGLVGFFFGWYFQYTRSLWSITVAHSLMGIGMLLLYPAL
jgi:uncharacterized protein